MTLKFHEKCYQAVHCTSLHLIEKNFSIDKQDYIIRSCFQRPSNNAFVSHKDFLAFEVVILNPKFLLTHTQENV